MGKTKTPIKTNPADRECRHATRNPCRLCTPFGACMVFHGISGCVPFIHGPQGCATYIRRYLIGHYREPVDIACSNFAEPSTVFGGKRNLEVGLVNVMAQYAPEMIGICTTCLAETIGDDVPMFLHEIKKQHAGLPALVHVATPSYCGTHTDGFNRAVRSVIETLARSGARHQGINLFPGMLSPADLRYLKEIVTDFGLPATVLPDYSDSFDGVIWGQYEKNIEHGTPIASIEKAAGARASIEFRSTATSKDSAGGYLLGAFGTPYYGMPIPISVKDTDRFFSVISQLGGCIPPAKYDGERGRLIDAYIDGHKYVYGEEDLVVALAGFLSEIGVIPALCASGGHSGRLRDALAEQIPEMMPDVTVLEDTDFWDITTAARDVNPDLIVGNSNGYKLHRELGVPLVRVGLPIHDRLGAARILHVGYRGAQQLYDRIVNALIEQQQEQGSVGYTHI
jgi:nitrogenase molybdenum-iron protein NifN